MQLCPRKWGPVWWSTRQQKWVGMHYITGSGILTVDLLKINLRWPMTQMEVKTLKMLETSILSQFNLIQDRKSVFSSQILSLLRSQSCGLRGERIGGILFVIRFSHAPFGLLWVSWLKVAKVWSRPLPHVWTSFPVLCHRHPQYCRLTGWIWSEHTGMGSTHGEVSIV